MTDRICQHHRGQRNRQQSASDPYREPVFLLPPTLHVSNRPYASNSGFHNRAILPGLKAEQNLGAEA
jgi:hypothetical protein